MGSLPAILKAHPDVQVVMHEAEAPFLTGAASCKWSCLLRLHAVHAEGTCLRCRHGALQGCAVGHPGIQIAQGSIPPLQHYCHPASTAVPAAVRCSARMLQLYSFARMPCRGFGLRAFMCELWWPCAGETGDVADAKGPNGEAARWLPQKGSIKFYRTPGHSPGLVSMGTCSNQITGSCRILGTTCEWQACMHGWRGI